MAEAIRDPLKLQAQVNEFQRLGQQLQILDAQEQQLNFLIDELKQAQEELKKSSGAIYKAAGHLLIEIDKKSATEEVIEKLELYQNRLKSLQKQRDSMKQKFNELRQTIESSIAEQKNVSE
ncbi:MAG: prefoldin subunit [Candidatus Micrarchaeota archaeon]|nr:prefoldin subunit [Candidatus Micrarchaeota archaeon]